MNSMTFYQVYPIKVMAHGLTKLTVVSNWKQLVYVSWQSIVQEGVFQLGGSFY